MKYLIGFTSEDLAKTKSRSIAEEQGAHKHITEFWFEIIKHYLCDEWALVIPSGEEDKLTQKEILLLKTREEMEADDWFAPAPIGIMPI